MSIPYDTIRPHVDSIIATLDAGLTAADVALIDISIIEMKPSMITVIAFRRNEHGQKYVDRRTNNPATATHRFVVTT